MLKDIENKLTILNAIQKDCKEKLADPQSMGLGNSDENETAWLALGEIQVNLEALYSRIKTILNR